jgi:hypothetical protein
MTQNLLSIPETEKIYKQRKIDVEAVFEYLKAILGFNSYVTTGKIQNKTRTWNCLKDNKYKKNGSSKSYQKDFKNEIQWKFNFTNEFPLYFYFLEYFCTKL